MRQRSELRTEPTQLGSDTSVNEMQFVVAYANPELTRALLLQAVVLTAGLHARITLLAVHTVPDPTRFRGPCSAHAFLVEQLLELAAECPVPVAPQVVLARSREQGFRAALPPEATILVGSRRLFRPTEEEILAGLLASDGHNVSLLYLD